MRGRNTGSNRWDDLMGTVRRFMTDLSFNDPYGKVSVIAYDDLAQVVMRDENPNESLVNRIEFTGYGTDFNAPLLEAYDLIHHEDSGISTKY